MTRCSKSASVTSKTMDLRLGGQNVPTSPNITGRRWATPTSPSSPKRSSNISSWISTSPASRRMKSGSREAEAHDRLVAVLGHRGRAVARGSGSSSGSAARRAAVGVVLELVDDVALESLRQLRVEAARHAAEDHPLGDPAAEAALELLAGRAADEAREALAAAALERLPRPVPRPARARAGRPRPAPRCGEHARAPPARRSS